MRRYKLGMYEVVKNDLIKDKRNFTTEETNYTKKIKLDKGEPILFSDDSFDASEMKLINLVREDIKKSDKEFKLVTENDICWYNSCGMENGKGYEVWKLDIDSAYWHHAIREGIISEKTNNFFEANKIIYNEYKAKGLEPKVFMNGVKPARLKALGALATKKIITVYEKGIVKEIDGRLKHTKVNDYNRNVYLSICLDIDMMMRALCSRYYKYARYYYWDCIFLDKGVDISEVVEFVQKDLGYGCKIEETRIYANFSDNDNGCVIDVNKLMAKEHATYPVRVNS